jgi:hypothetical protein
VKEFWPVLAAIILFLALLPGNKPVPVDPVPPPDPVVPVPGPDDPKVTGLRVIMVHESGAPMTNGQGNVLYSADLTEWLNENCTKDDGRPGWRRWDKDVPAAHESALWKALWKDSKPKIKELPAIVVVHGTDGKAYRLPETVEEAKRLAGGE